MASKVSVFRKVKEIHGRIGGATPQILISMITRELNIDAEEAVRHLDGLLELQLVKYKGTKKGAVELTKIGITTNMSPAPIQPQAAVPETEPETESDTETNQESDSETETDSETEEPATADAGKEAINASASEPEA